MLSKGTWPEALKNLKFGTDTHYSQFEADGTLTMGGDASVFNDVMLSVFGLRVGSSAPTFAAFKDTVYGLRFDDGKTDEMHGTFEIPHDYKEGSVLDIHIHWSPTTTDTGLASFTFNYTIANRDGLFGNTVPLTNTQAGSGVALQHQSISLGTITDATLKIGAILAFRLSRNGTTDAFTGNAFVHQVGIHYEADTLGSRSIYLK